MGYIEGYPIIRAVQAAGCALFPLALQGVVQRGGFRAAGVL